MNKHEPLPADTPDFFYGTKFAVDEIVLATESLRAKVASLKQGNESRTPVQQKLAAEEIEKIAIQIKALADVLVRQTIAHINRRPRP